MKKPPAAQSSASTRASGGLLADSVQLGWSVLTSGWTLVVVGCLLAAVYLAGAHVSPVGASFKELLDTHTFAASRTMNGLGLNDPAAGWVALFLYLIACLNGLGLFLRYGLGALGSGSSTSDSEETTPDGPTATSVADTEAAGAWTTSQTSTIPNVAVHEVVQQLPSSFARTRRQRGTRVVTAQRGLWDGAWILVGAGALTLLGSIAIDRGGAFEGRIQIVPGTSQPSETEFRADSGMWIKRPGLRIVCLPADPNDRQRTRKCRVPSPQGGEPVEVALAAGTEANVDGLRLRQVRELPLPALIDEKVGPSLLIRGGGKAASPQKLQVESDGATYRVGGKKTDGSDQQIQVTSFFGPDGPFVVASVPGGKPTLLTPALGRPAEPVPGTNTYIAGIPWWRVEFRASTDPGMYLRLTGAALLLLGLLLMLAVPDLRLQIRPVGDNCLVTLRSSNRRGIVRSEMAALVKGFTGRKAKTDEPAASGGEA